MDDSDDYLVDDFVFDDRTLAVLDQAEQKYLHQNTSSASRVPEEPANKRQKTANGWGAGIGANVARQEDDDDLPEISLRGDGSYAFGGTANGSNGSTSKQGLVQPNAVQRSTFVAPVFNLVPARAPARPPNRQPYSHSTASRFSNPLASTTNVSSRPRTTDGNGIIKDTKTFPENGQDAGPSNGKHLQMQVLEMQKQLAELREENSKIQSALKEAIEVKLVKEGEVSILRKGIEKTSLNHATQVALLKAEKEKAAAKQADMHKEMREEMERLRTQFLFKQQELESSIRRPPASVRVKKAGRDILSTPVSTSAAMRNWNKDPSQGTSSRRTSDETPLRPSRPPPPVFKASPSKQARRSPERSKKLTLPGFQNAFETSTPVRSPSKRLNKGKAKMDQHVFALDMQEATFGYSQQMPTPPSQFEGKRTAMEQEESFTLPRSSNASGPEDSQANDDDMDVVAPEDENDGALEELLEQINWKSELCRIVLTHTHPSINQITFQQLLGTTQSVTEPQRYSASCAKILGVMATSTDDDYDESLRIVCRVLLTLLATLHESHQILSLVILLDLMTRLTLALPTFRAVLLSSRLAEKEDSVMDIIGRVIVEQLPPEKVYLHRDELAQEVMNLLESLCFHSFSELQQIQTLARNREALMLFVNPSQSPIFLAQASRILVLLSTHQDLWESLLGQNTNETGENAKDLLHERLCSHLVDLNRPLTDIFKTYILTYFAQLSIAHTAAHAALVDSANLIPSLIFFVSYLTLPLWEDDGQLEASKVEVSSLMKTINQTMFLLHYLIFGTDPSLNLRSKLYSAALQRPFSCISHIFTVTFGRMSYCDPPSWLDAEQRQELEYIAEIARDVLELVIDGPEGDSLWAAFQSEPDEESAVDEEEMEARLIG